MSGENSKRTFLTVYDYGMGGIWSFITARTKDEIRAKYPELTVIDERPEWMTDEKYDELVRKIRLHIDIDEKPSGWFEAVVANRENPKA